jgi:hypothetical protein
VPPPHRETRKSKAGRGWLIARKGQIKTKGRTAAYIPRDNTENNANQRTNSKQQKGKEKDKETTLYCGTTAEYWEIEAKEGLPSADRNNKATLLLTGPFRTAKSSAKDLIPHPPKLQYASRRRALPARRGVRLLRCEAGAYSYAPEACGRYRRVPARILT